MYFVDEKEISIRIKLYKSGRRESAAKEKIRKSRYDVK